MLVHSETTSPQWNATSHYASTKLFFSLGWTYLMDVRRHGGWWMVESVILFLSTNHHSVPSHTYAGGRENEWSFRNLLRSGESEVFDSPRRLRETCIEHFAAPPRVLMIRGDRRSRLCRLWTQLTRLWERYPPSAAAGELESTEWTRSPSSISQSPSAKRSPCRRRPKSWTRLLPAAAETDFFWDKGRRMKNMRKTLSKNKKQKIQNGRSHG